jgi:acetoin utilization deacetylase AcuC-like enzyme
MTNSHASHRVPAWAHDAVEFPLPDGHRFPLPKYRLLRERVSHLVDARQAPPADWQLLERVHDAEYVRRIRSGELSRREERAIGIPWSPQLVERGRRSTQATVHAAHDALRYGYGINLGGGTHHAHRASARGYCLFNDIAAAVESLPSVSVLVVDADVHQGDGTADILTGHPRVTTMSIHGGGNYPFQPVPSDIDVALPNGTAGDAYLAALRTALDAALQLRHPDIVFYIAGADPWEGDALGRLKLTKDDLHARDRMVIHTAEAVGAAVCLTLGGGYAPDVADTVDINARSVELVARQWQTAHRSSTDNVIDA